MPTLTDILVQQGALRADRVTELVGASDELQRVRALVARGVISEARYGAARAAQVGVPFVRLDDQPVDPEVVTRIPAAIARKHEIVPVTVTEQNRVPHVLLAMAHPEDVVAIDDVQVAFGMPVSVVVATAGDIQRCIDRHHRADSELNQLSSTLADFEDAPSSAAESAFSVGETGDDEGAPIVRFVNLMLSQAIRDRASDIHVEPAEDRVRVRYRIDGVLHEMPSAPKTIQAGLTSRLKIMSDIDIAERRIPQDGRISVTHQGRTIDLRVATLPTVWGEKIVMRILDQAGTALAISSLDLSERNLRAFRTAYTKPYGMILVTGPTGSGKSTTLYSTVAEIARPEVNVITIEDPVEYRLPGINQVQVNTQAGLTFATALRSILRSDPDVMLVGEIRDPETASIAIESALTGHLVLSTLHTNDAPSAVTRLIEMGVEPFLVGSAIDVVVAQRLVRKLCERCKQPDQLAEVDLAPLGLARDAGDERIAYRAVGCDHCAGTGYLGRLAIHEVMTVTEPIERLAVERASSTDIARAAREQGMVTLREDGWQKVLAGRTSLEEILRVVA
ncbi:GspE/PulE family protein [Microbacterium album]|uniref:Bacterial type II secretion system protein E domain-containing protein n=1 Tax=Microbacterium album TaxID=2053191 RepID=A0A917IGP5_9MICO|nr:ATPase, T2SS/T4P/T4SS family [Microbacterium album]GGH50393.1 hypothetical protein GCM10010921_29120 [Microbacterium album]